MAKTDFYYDGTTACTSASTNRTPTKGLLTRTVRWLSTGTDSETRATYDSYGNPTCVRDANGNTIAMAYDSQGIFELSSTNALGHITQNQYYGVDGVAADNGLYGQVKQVTDPNGAVTSMQYDGLGRETKVTQPDGFYTTTSYNNFGTIATQYVHKVNSLGLFTKTYFDGLERITSVEQTGTDSKTLVTETKYDARGTIQKKSLPYFKVGGTALWTTFVHDPLDRILQITEPDGSITKMCFYGWVSVTVDANSHKVRTTLDANGKGIKVQEYSSTFTSCSTPVGTPYATTTHQYDVLGNLRFVTDAKNNQTETRYDSLSRKTYMHDPDMSNWSYVYDVAGNLTQQTDAKSQQTHFQYDALNRQVQKDYGTKKTLAPVMLSILSTA